MRVRPYGVSLSATRRVHVTAFMHSRAAANG
ncbi:hypothetical protein M2156_008869 [Streptomyces sp. SAI-149]|nr:hypothetical protein [Streptomyces sp. SAI-149]